MIVIKDPDSFERVVSTLRLNLTNYGQVVDTGEWQAKQGTPFDRTLELEDVSFNWPIPANLELLQAMVKPNLPWAEDHFLERISGQPLNPPPSHEYWPFAQAGNSDHRLDGKFSHTYPERFWPKEAGDNWGPARYGAHKGIRFNYGDLSDLIELLRDRPNTRQAFLPIWFPEDLMATRLNERVPCTLGYHFMVRNNELSCRYYMRSCDFNRHFRDDVYMAARLTQYIAEILTTEKVMAAGHELSTTAILPGKLVMHISSLHIFENERDHLKDQVKKDEKSHSQKIAENLSGAWW